MENKMIIRTMMLLLTANIYGVNISVFAQVKNKVLIPLPAPQLKTNVGGVYTETCWELDRMKCHYTMPSDNPESPGDIFNPVFQGSVSAFPPVIGEYTLEAKEDRSINTMGKDFTVSGNNGKDTRVWIYRQTTATDGRLYNPGLVRSRDDYLVCTIDRREPYGMYLMWVENANGAGYPVRINAAEATWLGPSHVTPGSEVSVYGRNLSYHNDTVKSYVYIRAWGTGSGEETTPVKVGEVNPYKVTFTVPSDIAAGRDYEVWLHNGHGGKYGWSGPLKLHIDVSDPYVWEGRVINVKDFGATGDGFSDDSRAIQEAINSANNGDRIYFPSGTYRLIANALTSDKKVSFEGAGARKTTVMTDSEFAQSQMLSITDFPARILNMGFRTLKPDGEGLHYLVRAEGPGRDDRAYGFIVQQSIFETAPFGGNAIATGLYGIICMYTGYIDDIIISDNSFTTQCVVWTFASEGVTIKNNTIFGNWKVTRGNGNLLLSFKGNIKKMDISNNFFQSVDHEGSLDDGDEIIIRAIVFQTGSGGRYDRIYIGGNYVDRAGNPWDNSGEIILFELPTSRIVYNPTSVSTTTMTLPRTWRTNALNNQTVAIIKNTGIGQYRRIIANEGNQITVDRPWDVPPDLTSVVSMNTSADNVVIYKNKIIGIPNYYEQESATSGIQLYGAAFNNVIADNNFSNVHHGIYIQGFSAHPSTDGHSTGSMGNLITGNTITNAVYGLKSIIVMYRYVMPSPLPEDIPWSANVNNVFRDNYVSNMVQFTVDGVKHGGYGIIVGQLYNDWQNPVWNGPWVREILVEHNTVTDAAGNYMWFRQHQQFCTARRNNFIDNNKYENTTGIFFSPQNKDSYIIDNTISKNIDIRYDGTLPGPQLQLTKRSLSFEVTGEKDAPDQTLRIRNAGTGSLILNVSEDVPWINVELSTNKIDNENENSVMTVKVNSSELQTGSYYGTITVHGGTPANIQEIGVTMVIRKGGDAEN
jgi:parallel beta-helix repeat protein